MKLSGGNANLSRDFQWDSTIITITLAGIPSYLVFQVPLKCVTFNKSHFFFKVAGGIASRNTNYSFPIFGETDVSKLMPWSVSIIHVHVTAMSFFPHLTSSLNRRHHIGTRCLVPGVTTRTICPRRDQHALSPNSFNTGEWYPVWTVQAVRRCNAATQGTSISEKQEEYMPVPSCTNASK